MDHKVEINCNLCGMNDFKIIYERLEPVDDIAYTEMYGASQSTLSPDRIVKCRKCGLVYVNPRLHKEALDEAYVNGDHLLYLSHIRSKTLTFMEGLEWVEKFLPIDNSLTRRRILDVGSAAGLFLGIAEEKGWEVHGIEPNIKLAEYAQNHLHLNIYNGFLDNVSLPSDFFDAVTMWDVIEHLTDPKEALSRVRESLTGDGYLFLMTPDLNCIFSRILRRKWWFVMAHHLYYFTRSTIRGMLEETGFRVVNMKRHLGIWDRRYVVEMVKSLSKSMPNDTSNRALLLIVSRLPISSIRMYAGQMKVAARKR